MSCKDLEKRIEVLESKLNNYVRKEDFVQVLFKIKSDLNTVEAVTNNRNVPEKNP